MAEAGSMKEAGLMNKVEEDDSIAPAPSSEIAKDAAGKDGEVGDDDVTMNPVPTAAPSPEQSTGSGAESATPEQATGSGAENVTPEQAIGSGAENVAPELTTGSGAGVDQSMSSVGTGIDESISADATGADQSLGPDTTSETVEAADEHAPVAPEDPSAGVTAESANMSTSFTASVRTGLDGSVDTKDSHRP
ncbi:hypothetical protein BDW72DRAFT_175555 [Aspergillus terricola var. indicus]